VDEILQARPSLSPIQGFEPGTTMEEANEIYRGLRLYVTLVERQYDEQAAEIERLRDELERAQQQADSGARRRDANENPERGRRGRLARRARGAVGWFLECCRGIRMTTTVERIRAATPDDAHELAELINFAGEGMPLYLWERMANVGEDPWEVGRRRARREQG